MSARLTLSYEFGPFRLDPSEHRLTRDGRTVALTPKAFDVLRLLVEHAGHLVEKDTLVTEVWPDNFVEEGALNRNVSILRKALGETAEHFQADEHPPLFGSCGGCRSSSHQDHGVHEPGQGAPGWLQIPPHRSVLRLHTGPPFSEGLRNPFSDTRED